MIGAPGASTPFRTLTRYFFTSFFRLSFLDDAGEESFKRGIAGVLAAVIAFGLLLTRLYIGKYAGFADPDALAAAKAADRLFLLTMPMLVTMFVMALSSHAIFPDEADFRILMALPLSRSTVFAAKFAALLFFAAIFAAGTTFGLVLPLSIMVNGYAARPVLTTGIQLGMGAWSAAFAVALVIAVEGLITVTLPRTVLRRVSVAIQTAIVASLVLLLPVVFRIPGMEESIGTHPRVLMFLPPGWLLRAEEWLLGDHSTAVSGLTLVAVVGSGFVLLTALGCSLAIYRRFDQSVLRPNTGRAPWTWNRTVRLPFSQPAAGAAVRDFMAATLRRGGLHQLVFASICAAGMALAINSILGSLGRQDRWVVAAALRAPFTVMAAVILGLRLALRLPTNLRAGWIFRMTETSANRRHQLDVVGRALFLIGVVLPVALAVPVHIAMLGARTSLMTTAVMLLIGWAFTEAACLDWRRIPFTCTFLFAKRPAPVVVLMMIAVFGWFVDIAGGLVGAASAGVVPWLIVTTVIAVIGTILRMFRLANWGRWPLEFEDYLPDGLDTLRLGP